MKYTTINIYPCDTEVNAEAARLVLEGLHFDEITVDEVTGLVEYDADKYGGGGKKDTPGAANYVVIGKKK